MHPAQRNHRLHVVEVTVLTQHLAVVALVDQHIPAALARATLDAWQVLLAHPQVMIPADDVYEHLIFDGRNFVTLAQVEPRLAARPLTMNGVSKAYAMTG